MQFDDVRYIGGDVVDEVIEENKSRFGELDRFYNLDLLNDEFPAVDILFCRDCLVHLCNREIEKALQNIRRAGLRYFLSTTFPYCSENLDTVAPCWREINLELAPFLLPPPVEPLVVRDDTHSGKYIGVWEFGAR